MNYIDMIDPANPISVLVAADWLEESGRTTEAGALRMLAPPPNSYGISDGYGHGYSYGNGYSDGYADRYGDGYGNSYNDNYGDGDGYGEGYGRGCGLGEEYSYTYGREYYELVTYLSHVRIFIKSYQSSYQQDAHELP